MKAKPAAYPNGMIIRFSPEFIIRIISGILKHLSVKLKVGFLSVKSIAPYPIIKVVVVA